MKIEYLAGMQPQVEHVTAPELHRWTAEHPQAVIVHATPEPGDDLGRGRCGPASASGGGTAEVVTGAQAGW